MLGRTTRRPSAPPPAYHGELVALTTPSGYTLSVAAAEPRAAARGTVVLLHPLLASKRVFLAPGKGRGLAQALVDCGLRVLSLDFRGHGESTPWASQGGAWDYDALVREDLPVLVRAARERWPHERLSVVGHSLGGHVALASAATNLVEVDAIAVLATSVWLPQLDPNPARRLKKGAMLQSLHAVTKMRGYLPARAFGLGSDDEAAGMVRSLVGFWTRAAWVSSEASSETDYLDALARLRTPVLAVASAGDRFVCSPDTALRFARHIPAGLLSFDLLRFADDGGPAPDHMAMVTTRAVESMWHRVAAFCSGS